MKFRREEIKSDFYVALKVQLEIFSFSFLSFFFFQISSNIFLSAKTCVHGPGIFFFYWDVRSLFGKLHDVDENLSERKIVSC